MKTIIKTISVCLSIIAVNADDAIANNLCPSSKIIFSCITKSKKKIEVCDLGKIIKYSFGSEFYLNVPRDKVSTYQWNGNGRYISYTVRIPNENYIYEVYLTADRLTEGHDISGGVSVEKNDEMKSNIKCVEKGMINNIEGVKLKNID